MPPTKAAAQRLQGRGAYIGQCRYGIVNIPKARTNSEYLFSLWVAMAGYGPSTQAANVSNEQVPSDAQVVLPVVPAVCEIKQAMGTED